MGQNQFVFRRYMETDADTLYSEYLKFNWANIQPYFSGVGIGMEREAFLAKFQQFSKKQYRPPIVADENDHPCGVYRITYHHANRYHELTLHTWEKRDLVKPVLKQIVDQALHKDIPEGKLLLRVPGYELDLKVAAENLGLELVGTIPNYLCHDDTIHNLYLYVITAEKWYSM